METHGVSFIVFVFALISQVLFFSYAMSDSVDLIGNQSQEAVQCALAAQSIERCSPGFFDTYENLDKTRDEYLAFLETTEKSLQSVLDSVE
ncbi:MAG: hypothetical protein ACMXYF_02390 [Candidatus Woesearchaeota archaeon]